jgi:hypothetical protein
MIWILYALNEWPLALFLGGSTIVAWWRMSNYYGWPLLLDRGAFLLASALLVVLAGLAVRFRILQSGLRPHNGAFATRTLPGIVWKDMLQLVRRNRTRDPFAKRFLAWRANRLDTSAEAPEIHGKGVFSVRHDSGRALWKGLVLAAWLPFLCCVLLFVPLHTNVMEFVVRQVAHRPNRFFKIENEVQVVAEKKRNYTIYDELKPDPGTGCLFRPDTTGKLGRGVLTVRATDFPRVYRRVVATCVGDTPTCGMPDAGKSQTHTFDLVGGTARISFFQMPAQVHLNMTLLLQTAKGDVLDFVCIEPN